MRRLLDACAAAVDLVVQEASEQQPEQNKGDGAMSEAAAPAPLPKLVGIAPMFRAISQLQGGQHYCFFRLMPPAVQSTDIMRIYVHFSEPPA